MTMIDLSSLLHDQGGRKETPMRERRAQERHPLEAVEGELIYKGAQIPCQFIDVSMGGCCIQTGRRFAAGALANVEIVLPLFGVVLKIVGVTQWLNFRNQIGIRFFHPSSRSKNELAGLISCLIDKSAAEVFLEANAPKVQVQEEAPAPEVYLEDVEAKAVLMREVHNGAPIVKSLKIGEWPASIRSPKEQLNVPGAILDLSLIGCSVRTVKPYTGQTQAGVEVEFEIRGLPFRLGGVTRAIYDSHSVGIQFIPMANRKREELGQAIEELSPSA